MAGGTNGLDRLMVGEPAPVQQGPIQAPDFQPGAVRRARFVVRRRNPRDAAAVRRPPQQVFGMFDLVVQLPVELRVEAVTKEQKDAARVHGQQHGQCRRVRKRESSTYGERKDSPPPPPPSPPINPTPRPPYTTFTT